jgi:hypothetical protein
MDHTAPSEAVIDLFELAFEHAFGSIAKGGPLVPFSIIEIDGERILTRYPDGELTEAVEHAKSDLREFEPRPDRAVLAFESYLTLDDEHGRSDAISVFAQEGADSFQLGMRFKYVKKLLGTRVKLIDEMPRLLDSGQDPLLW